MNPEQALSTLDQATQPGIKLTRQDYLHVEQALRVIATIIKDFDSQINQLAKHQKEVDGLKADLAKLIAEQDEKNKPSE